MNNNVLSTNAIHILYLSQYWTITSWYKGILIPNIYCHILSTVCRECLVCSLMNQVPSSRRYLSRLIQLISPTVVKGYITDGIDYKVSKLKNAILKHTTSAALNPLVDLFV